MIYDDGPTASRTNSLASHLRLIPGAGEACSPEAERLPRRPVLRAIQGGPAPEDLLPAPRPIPSFAVQIVPSFDAARPGPAIGHLSMHLASAGIPYKLASSPANLPAASPRTMAGRAALGALLPFSAAASLLQLSGRNRVVYLELGSSPEAICRDLALMGAAASLRLPVVVHARDGQFRGTLARLPSPVARSYLSALGKVDRAIVPCPGLRVFFEGVLPLERVSVVFEGTDPSVAEAAELAPKRLGGKRRLSVLLLDDCRAADAVRLFLSTAELAAGQGRRHCFVAAAGEGEDPTLGSGLSERRFELAGLRVASASDRASRLDLLRQADVLAIPVWPGAAGPPQGLLDAMHFGAAVVAASTGGIGDVVAHRTNGLIVNRRNPVALLQAIDALAREPDLRTRIARSNRATARACFTATAHSAGVASVLLSVMAER